MLARGGRGKRLEREVALAAGQAAASIFASPPPVHLSLSPSLPLAPPRRVAAPSPSEEPCNEVMRDAAHLRIWLALGNPFALRLTVLEQRPRRHIQQAFNKEKSWKMKIEFLVSAKS